MGGSWRPDLLPGFEAIDLALSAVVPAPGEPSDTELVGTLVRRASAPVSRTAVLYLHGWNDYFFHTELAADLVGLGYDPFALDLRRCGRSLRPGQLRGYVTDLGDYDVELSQAADVIGADHDRLILLGHSTGGLVAALWAARRPGRVQAVILTSPWLDLHRPVGVAKAATSALDPIARRRPTWRLPLPDLGLTVRSVHEAYGGEWDYDLELKTTPSPPIRLGWLRAVRAAQARVAQGLDLPMPVLVLLSARHAVARRWRDELREVDIVLDADHVARRALDLGGHVTVVRVPAAMHDLLLSREPARRRAVAEIGSWCAVYG